MNPTESSKQPEASEEEEKVLTSKSTDISSEMIKQRTISEADLDCRPIKYDEGSLGEELSEGEGEEGPMDGKPKPKWNILGSIKNFFFKDTNLTQPATQQKTEDIGKVPAYVQSSDGSQMR